MERTTVALCAATVFLLLWLGVSSRVEPEPVVSRLSNLADSVLTCWSSDICSFGTYKGSGPVIDMKVVVAPPPVVAPPAPVEIAPAEAPPTLDARPDAIPQTDLAPAPAPVPAPLPAPRPVVEHRPVAHRHHHRKRAMVHHRRVAGLRCIPWLPCQYGLIVYAEKHRW
jgi:hypothetical protein